MEPVLEAGRAWCWNWGSQRWDRCTCPHKLHCIADGIKWHQHAWVCPRLHLFAQHRRESPCLAKPCMAKRDPRAVSSMPSSLTQTAV